MAVHANTDQVAAPARPASVLFVGDSYTAGVDVAPDQTYAALIAHRAKWDLYVDAQGATGFVRNGQGTGNGDTSRLIDRLADDGRRFADVDLLIVDAGRNDLDGPVADLEVAMSDYLTAARRQWPIAKIVAILPSYVRPGEYDGYATLRDAFAHGLAAVGGTLVDPVAEGWYGADDVASLVDADGVHPNAAGNAHIADRLEASLRSKGFIDA